jgi:hypothetical protein
MVTEPKAATASGFRLPTGMVGGGEGYQRRQRFCEKAEVTAIETSLDL